MSLRVGDLIGDLALVQADGGSIKLAAFAGRTLLMVFLRHLA